MQELIVYQIGNNERRNQYRFVITFDFQDAVVEAQLKPGEFIDSTSTLSGVLGGEASVVMSANAGLQSLLKQYGEACERLGRAVASVEERGPLPLGVEHLIARAKKQKSALSAQIISLVNGAQAESPIEGKEVLAEGGS